VDPPRADLHFCKSWHSFPSGELVLQNIETLGSQAIQTVFRHRWKMFASNPIDLINILRHDWESR
jgi:hypothetical protein